MTTADTHHVRVAEGIYAVPHALPARVEPVNGYLLVDADGAVIVDTGLVDALPQWERVCAALNIPLASIRAIVATHFHPDHIGCVAPLQERTGAQVLASSRTILDTEIAWGARSDTLFDAIDEQWRTAGMAPDMIARLRRETDVARSLVAASATFTPLNGGAELVAGGRSWRVLAVPGHAEGQVVLFSEETGELLSADHVLERISPTVAIYPQGDPNPLADYYDSLRRVADLDVRAVYPGHGAPFSRIRERVAALVAHHAARLEACRIALQQAPGAPAAELSAVVFGKQADDSQDRFALAETLAHLTWLRENGEAATDENSDGLIAWHPLNRVP